jgi:hypothetical protein
MPENCFTLGENTVVSLTHVKHRSIYGGKERIYLSYFVRSVEGVNGVAFKLHFSGLVEK